MKHKSKRERTNKPLTIIGWILSLLIIGPLYIMIINSFKNRKQIFTDSLGFPESFNFEYYREAMEKMDYWNALKNSIFVVGVSVILIVVLASMAAWALTRRNSKSSNAIYLIMVTTIIIPFQSVMLPLVQYFYKWRIEGIDFKMIGSHYGLIFFNVGFGMAMAIFLYSGAIKNIPVEMEESAYIDGANKFQTFWHIVFPNLMPITATVAILNIISYWNDYLLPSLVLTSNPKLRTIPLSTFNFFGVFTIQWNLALAGLVLTIIPVLIFYIFAQRWIVKGIMAGSVKG